MPTEKFRVLHVIARFNVGGTARYLDNLIPGLSEHFETLLAVGHVQGYEVEDSGLEKIDFKRIKHLGRKINLYQDCRAYLELRKTVKLFKPQIIHSHTFKAGVLARVMFFRIPKVHTFHGHLMGDPEFSRFALKVIIYVERFLARFTKKLITVGEQVSKDLLQVEVGNPSQYISIASEGRILNFCSRDQARTNLDIPAEATVVLWMARMAPVKNPSLALEVARQLPGIYFLMAGGGELYSQVKSQAPFNVRLLGWVVAEEVIPAADIFLSTSLNEGVPFSIIEALSAGVPVVAVESGAIGEIIKNGINGILTSNDPTEIAHQISDSIAHLSLGLVDRKIVSRLSVDKSQMNSMVSSHLDLYMRILNDDVLR